MVAGNKSTGSRKISSFRFSKGVSNHRVLGPKALEAERLLAEEKLAEAAPAHRARSARERLAEASINAGNDNFSSDSGFDLDDFPSSSLQNEHAADANDGYVTEGEEQDSDEDNEDPRVVMIKSFGKSYKRGRLDTRSRKARNAASEKNWELQMDKLVKVYLRWKYPLALGTDTSEVAAEDTVCTFRVYAISIFEVHSHEEIGQRPNETANEALIRHGILGSSPISPSTGFSLKALELYHQIRRRQPNFSVQAMMKVLCALNNASLSLLRITYKSLFRTHFSQAFDVYLGIQRRVQAQVSAVLARDNQWRARHSCPCCNFKLDNEAPLHPARLQAMDGNVSLKRVEHSGSSDTREFNSNYLIPAEEVNRFQNDVRSRPGAARMNTQKESEAMDIDADEDESSLQACTDNWTAAKASSEATVQIFEQSGIFLSLCRHGLVQWFSEMIRSGELAKYALSMDNKILDTYGEDQAIGYDIGCTHKATVRNSSLSDKAKLLRILFLVNAFHGHAHNRGCQLLNHPLYINGIGIEDFETCERFFSGSNAVASLVRHASHFHFLQFIDLYCDQSDKDKYLELSNFLYNNFIQAYNIIAENQPLVDDFKIKNKFTDDDFMTWIKEEKEYLQTIKNDSQRDSAQMAYVEALEHLSQEQLAFDKMAEDIFIMNTPIEFRATGGTQPTPSAQYKEREALRRQTVRKLEVAMKAADCAEKLLGVTTRWERGEPEYEKALQHLHDRQFLRIVNRLEYLVVQRIFELCKAHLAGTGYKLRIHISKAIVRRSAAIRTALEQYNRLAPLQNPRRPILKFADIVSAAWVGDFDLIRHSPHDVDNKHWALPANREMASKYFKIVRAKEEIHRCKIEMERLRAWIAKEEGELTLAISQLTPTNPLLAAVIQDRYDERHRVNNVHRRRLAAIDALPQHSSTPTPRPLHSNNGGVNTTTTTTRDDLDPEEDGELAEEVTRLEECMERIVS